MSSDLYLYGVFTFPCMTRAAWLNADLIASEEGDEEGVSFQGKSEHDTVEAAIEEAGGVYRFLDFINEGADKFVLRGALGDDEWYPWATTIGAMARAAAQLGAAGHVEVLDDGNFIGRLSIKSEQAVFNARSKPADRAGERAQMTRFEAWLKEEAARFAKKKPTSKPKAKKRVESRLRG